MKKYILILTAFIGLISCKEETIADRIITNMENHPNDWVWQEAGIKDTIITYSTYLNDQLLCDTLVNKNCGIKIIIDPEETVSSDVLFEFYAMWRLVIPDTLEFNADEIKNLRNAYNEYIQEPIERPKRERLQAVSDSISNVEQIKLKEKKDKILRSICKN